MTTSISQHNAIISANNQGISLLKQSRYTDAIAIFRRELKAIHRTASHHWSNLQGEGDPLTNAPYSRACGHFMIEDDIRVVLSVPVLQEVDREGDEDIFLAFNRALTISIEMVFFIETEDLKHLTSAILLYNIGLSLQLKARHRGASQVYEQAIKFYEMSYECLRQQELFDQPHFSTLAVMAILNNIGNIHAYFCRFYETNMFRQHLLSFLIVEQKCANQLCASLVDDESEFFTGNCLSFPSWQQLAASAA